MNIKDYIRWRGDVPMRQDPFNEVDNLILSELVYIRWDGVADVAKPITLKQAYEGYQRVHSDDTPDSDAIERTQVIYMSRVELARLAAESVRFSDIKVMNYVHDISLDEEKQFAAMVFQLPDKTYYVAFSGTDHTIVGWKEDFSMTYTCPVAAQKAAADYLKKIASRPFSSLMTGGHSKGGNLAVYAAAMLKQPGKIVAIYNNDGPGFPESFIKRQEYQDIVDSIHSLMPQASVIGRLMNSSDNPEIVHSEGHGIVSQHYPLTWSIDVNRIVREEKNTSESQFLQGVFNRWNQQLDLEEKMVFMNALFDVLARTGIQNSGEIARNKMAIVKQLISHISEMSDASRSICLSVLGALFRSNVSSFSNTYLDGIIRQARRGDKNENTGSE